jgi:chromate transporter
MDRAPVSTVAREWGRIGFLGFGGPPAHVALLRDLCVSRREWLTSREFEDANAACGLLPGPASTQLAIYCAHRVGGPAGALAGGLAFIVPGLVALIALAALALGKDPPAWIEAVGAGASAAVVAVVVQAGVDLTVASVRGRAGVPLLRAVAYVLAGAAATDLAGVGVVFVLLGCGLAELAVRRRQERRPPARHLATLPALAWTAFKVGALSYGGGFVIVPLMQADAVDAYGWMTNQSFVDAVAYGQLTPGPVTQTIAAVGYAAAGLGGALLAAAVAFLPSFAIVFLGGRRFERLRRSPRARAFLDGAGPAAVGAIFGAALPLAAALHEPWQYAVLGAAALALAAARPPIWVLAGGALAGLVALAV